MEEDDDGYATPVFIDGKKVRRKHRKPKFVRYSNKNLNPYMKRNADRRLEGLDLDEGFKRLNERRKKAAKHKSKILRDLMARDIVNSVDIQLNKNKKIERKSEKKQEAKMAPGKKLNRLKRGSDITRKNKAAKMRQVAEGKPAFFTLDFSDLGYKDAVKKRSLLRNAAKSFQSDDSVQQLPTPATPTTHSDPSLEDLDSFDLDLVCFEDLADTLDNGSDVQQGNPADELDPIPLDFDIDELPDFTPEELDCLFD